MKFILLLVVSYFFLGVSEGTFFFTNGTDTLINFLFTLLCVALNWILFKNLLLRFGKWFEGVWKSIVKTISLVLILSIHTTLLNWIYIEVFWGESLAGTPFFPVVLPLAMALFLLWALGHHWVQKLELRKVRTATQPEITFELRKGRQTLFKTLSQTMGFIVINKLVFHISRDGEQLLIDRPLSELEPMLADKGFFRINRQLLLTRDAIQSYKVINNERIEVSISSMPGIPSTCIVSRYKAPAFRKWLVDPPFGL